MELVRVLAPTFLHDVCEPHVAVRAVRATHEADVVQHHGPRSHVLRPAVVDILDDDGVGRILVDSKRRAANT